MHSKFNSRSGLSLLELLVSLALLALIGAGLAGAFGLGTQLWGRTAALGQYSQEIALRAQLRRYVSQALPPTRLTPFANPFYGNEDRFSFITLAATPFAPDAAAMRMGITLDGSTLRLRTELLDDDGVVAESWEDILAEDAFGLEIQYYAQDDTWLNEWSDNTRLPRLIRVRLNEGATPPWPEFTVRPRLQ